MAADVCVRWLGVLSLSWVIGAGGCSQSLDSAVTNVQEQINVLQHIKKTVDQRVNSAETELSIQNGNFISAVLVNTALNQAAPEERSKTAEEVIRLIEKGINAKPDYSSIEMVHIVFARHTPGVLLDDWSDVERFEYRRQGTSPFQLKFITPPRPRA